MESGPAPGRVRKRDGREVPFDRGKIAVAISRALAAVGEDDPAFAEEVAGVVDLTLRQRCLSADARSELPDGATAFGGADPAVPDIEEIQDLVERALIELGRARVAKAYILYRDRRARAREVVRFEPSTRVGDLTVQEHGGARPWSKGRIVSALLSEAGLPRASAEEVAARVERRVIDSGMRRVSTGLVRELVAGELVDLGLTAALARSEPVSLPRADLRHALEAGSLDDGAPAVETHGLEEVVGGEVLRRYALGDVLGDELADMHRSRDLHVEDLARPHQPLWLSVPAELLLTGEPTASGAFDLLDAAATVALDAARGLTLEDPGTALLPLARATRPGSPVGLAAWLRALAALGRATGRRVDLGSPGPRFASFTARVVEELVELPGEVDAPRLYLVPEEMESLLEGGGERAALLERGLELGRLMPVFGRPRERFGGPGCRRRPREHTVVACGGAVALDLYRLAREAGPWREDLVLEALADRVRCALDVFRQLAAFQRRHAAARAAIGRGGLRSRSAFALVPVGLREALVHLGGGEGDPACGARLLGFLEEAARRFRGPAGPDVVTSGFFGEAAARRFARRDAADGPCQEGLFGGPSDDVACPRSTGLAVTPLAGWWPGEAEGELATTLSAGALVPQTLGGAEASPTDEPRRVAAWRRFAARLREGGDPDRDLLFPVPPRAEPSGAVPPLTGTASPLESA